MIADCQLPIADWISDSGLRISCYFVDGVPFFTKKAIHEVTRNPQSAIGNRKSAIGKLEMTRR
jgi:hypothetical protein